MRTRVRHAQEAAPPEFVESDPRQEDIFRQILSHSIVQRAADVARIGASSPNSEALWNFVSMHGQLNDDDTEDERTLAQEIAKAMHHRPLMSRLARIEDDFSGRSGPLGRVAAAAATPPPLPQAAPNPVPALSSSIDELMEEFGEPPTSPSSAEWLGKARRERNRAKLRNVAAWFATLAIGGSIVSMTILMLHR